MSNHCFISYSAVDGSDFARKLVNKLEGGNVAVWFDKDDLKPGMDWDIQIDSALKGCRMILFVMTADSTHEKSVCRQEWSRALSFKKPIVPLWVQDNIDIPFRLQDRQRIDFRTSFDAGLANLRDYLAWLDSSEGILQGYKDRLLDAERDIQRASEKDKPRIQADIDQLKKQIETQQKVVDDPEAAEDQTQKNIETGLAREQQPEKHTATKTLTKFINPPPGIAPTYFQDRVIETEQVVNFLRNEAQHMITVVGRGGVGKTTMICRLLKHMERGELPDGKGKLSADGIVYLSEKGSRRVNFPHIFEDVSRLLPPEITSKLDDLYQNPRVPVGTKMQTLLESFPVDSNIVLLLDNFESTVEEDTQKLKDQELDEAMRTILSSPQHALKVIITTRVAPRELNLLEPARQRLLVLDDGLESPYAEEILKRMDEDGTVGLKTAPEALLRRAKERTRGYPRALEALFAILSADRYTTLAELLSQDIPENVVEALVGEAFSRLDPVAQKVMQALAIYDRPVTPAAIDYLLQPHVTGINSAPVLTRLTSMHFGRREAGRFYLHPVDKEYALSKVPKDLPVTAESVENKQVLEALQQSTYTQRELTLRAADYFAQARKPRTEWKKLDDLAAQLAEFDLRCAAGDYDTAASVLTDIDFDYLVVWGHYRLTIELHLRIKDRITDKSLRMPNLNVLGLAHRDSGNVKGGISFLEKGLDIAREVQNRGWEGVFLGNLAGSYYLLGELYKLIEFDEQSLRIQHEIGDKRAEGGSLGRLGLAYAALGDAYKAIAFYEQALIIDREIDDRIGEGADLVNKGLALLSLGEYSQARDIISQAIEIADEVSYSDVQLEGRFGLAQLYLFQNDLVNARSVIEDAGQYDTPQYNHNVSALQGIIALQQQDRNTARQAFQRSIEQANQILIKTPEYYGALDAKALALCGVVICEDRKNISDAVAAFLAARKIAPHAGIVKSMLRLFDELAKCDGKGILKDVRKAVEGKE